MAGMGWQNGWRGAIRHLLGDEGGWVQLAVQLGMMAASAIAANRARNRENRNAATQVQNTQEGDLYRTQQNALLQALLGQSAEGRDNARIDLDRQRFNLEAPRERGRQALLGSLLQNMQPARLTGLSPQLAARTPQISGGLTPAALGPLARQMGLLMQQNAVQGQQNPTQFSPLPQTNFLSGVMPRPQQQGYQGPGRMESILGLIGGIGGQAYNLYQQNRGNQFNGGQYGLNFRIPQGQTVYTPVIPGTQFSRNT